MKWKLVAITCLISLVAQAEFYRRLWAKDINYDELIMKDMH